ncbi:MAG: hypothetical protein RMJ75_02260 [Nitrososphaerota archaeon]|nr:hypothetical protein [Nitrososphaerota archaeon]
MRDAEIAELIRDARMLISKALELAEQPALRKSLADADMMLHWSLWHLGREDDLLPKNARAFYR